MLHIISEKQTESRSRRLFLSTVLTLCKTTHGKAIRNYHTPIGSVFISKGGSVPISVEAAVYGIVRNHDGWISVDSELGRGTTVRIYLPSIEVEIEKPKEDKAKAPTGTGTILMIEDEDVVIEVTQAMLEMLGYRVMVAKTGKDAIHIAETFDGQIDLALLDIKLPDIDGRHLYPLIMKARSNLKVIVFSGYSIDGPAREILDAGAQGFIQKPFSVSALSEKLKEVLEGE